MGDAQMRVTFDFAGAREVHYISDVPEVGDLITHGRELWVVKRVDEDDLGSVVTCELPPPQRA